MKMRRSYNLASYLEIIGQLKSRYPLFNFTTDIIVVFPGETEEDFNETTRIIREVGFSHVHTFKYSIRRGTRAERLEDQVAEKIKQERSLFVRNLALENKQKYRQQFLGKSQTVLVEKVYKGGIAKGYGQHYVPLEFKTDATHSNFFKTITIKDIGEATHDYVLKG
jgi:threonylcarbamoyladenosine tRNA methylthiotransferase MtaB